MDQTVYYFKIYSQDVNVNYLENSSIVQGFTWKGHQRRIVLAVRNTSGVRYTIHPQVGVVVDCGKYSITYLRKIPVLRRQSRTDQDPSTIATQKTANFYVHHSCATHFAGCILQSKRDFKGKEVIAEIDQTRLFMNCQNKSMVLKEEEH